jgi:hypothetical protein
MQADSPGPGESSRPPKRPWEDTQEEGVSASDAVGFQEVGVLQILTSYLDLIVTAVSCQPGPGLEDAKYSGTGHGTYPHETCHEHRNCKWLLWTTEEQVPKTKCMLSALLIGIVLMTDLDGAEGKSSGEVPLM